VEMSHCGKKELGWGEMGKEPPVGNLQQSKVEGEGRKIRKST